MILHHSILVRSVRWQIGCHGETWAYVTTADIMCPLIGHRSADAPDGVGSWLAWGLVLEMLTRTHVFLDMRTVNVNRRRECILLLRNEIGELC